MRLKRLKFKNYMTFDDVNIEFQPNKVYFIYGQNLDTGGSNGIGKSALLESIPAVIYGKSLRPGLNVNAVKELIRKGENKMYLEVELDNNIQIKRTRSKLKEEVKLIVDGKEVNIRLKTDVDEEIEKYLPSFEKFQYLDYFNPLTLQFFSFTPKQRMEIFEEILNLDKLTELYERYKSEFTNLMNKMEITKIECNNLDNRLKEIKQEIEQKNDQIKQMEKDEFNRLLEDEITNKKAIFERKSSNLNNHLIQLKELLTRYTKLKSLDLILMDKLRKEYEELTFLKKQVENLKKQPDTEICPLCKRPFEKEDKHEEIDINEFLKQQTDNQIDSEHRLEEKLGEIKETLGQFEEKERLRFQIEELIKNIQFSVSDFDETFYINEVEKVDNLFIRLEKLNSILSKLSLLNLEIPEINLHKNKELLYERLRKQVENSLIYFQQDVARLKEEYKKLELKLADEILKLEELSSRTKDYDIIVKELKGDFRNYVYNFYLETLQNSMRKYLKMIYPAFDLSLSIETKGRNKGFNVNISEGDTRQYGNLSSGEKRIIDLVFALSLSSFGSDILIVDEALNALSYDIKLKVLDILVNLDKQVFIVEHDTNIIDNLKYQFPQKVETINIIKQNSISKIC